MFDSPTFTQDMLSNPTKLAKAVIDAMQSTDTVDPVIINDPNNGFFMQLAANVSIFSKFSEKVDTVASFFYPQRARTAEQLYVHLSEFDYVDLMASPATLPFIFYMDRNWIISHSVYFDSNYNKIEIPATSFFTMGGITYSMYYPIEILVNRNTGAVTAFYDTTTSNNLNTLSSNMLLNVQQYTKNGIDLFQITFNMYQFNRTVTTYTVGSEEGFIRTLSFDDQFYAVTISTQNINGVWTELAYSLAQMYYDYQTPTALLSLLTDTGQIKIQIPQIYFDNNQISQTIKVELYSTKGAVSYSLSPADVTDVKAVFDTNSSIYAAPLTQMPTWGIFPTTTEVAGGSNVKSYAETRDAIVNQRLYNRVAVTTPEIIEAGKKAGFDLTRVTDDLTERMYQASNVLTDANGTVIPTFAGSIYIAKDSLLGDPSTILNYSDGYNTILPTTTFTIAPTGLICTPMTNGAVAAMATMTTDQVIDELNKGIYVRQPFHITLVTTPKSPQALIYNLLSPSLTSLTFIAENAHSAPQMSVTKCVVTHLNSGTGGYEILLGVTRSSNIQSSPAVSFNVYLTCLTKTGQFVYIPATYASTDTLGIDTWAIHLTTTYHITTDDFITVGMYDVNDKLVSAEIPLNQSFTIVTSFNNGFDLTIPVDQTLNPLLPPSVQSTQVVMANQTMVLSLGHNLSSQIYCGVNTSWGNDVYKTAGATIYYDTAVPIFQDTETGVINYRYNDTTHSVESVVLYPKDAVPSTTGDLLIPTITDTLVPTSKAVTTTYVLQDATGILVGMHARGTNIPLNAVVTAVVGTAVTLTGTITALLPTGSVITFTNPYLLVRTTVTQDAVGQQLSIENTNELLVGQTVVGFDIPKDTVITSIDSATQFSLSAATTNPIDALSLLTIVNKTAPGVIKTHIGDILTDANGNPIVVKDAQNQYLIPSILFDGRLFASQDPSDQAIVTTISQRLQNYANQITTIDAGLIEDSDVFYKPARTMGSAIFGIGGGKTITMSLELSFSLTIYVDASVYNTQTLLSSMSDTTFSIINTAIQNSIISLSDITTTIKQNLGTTASAVEMDNISGIAGLRLISLEDAGATPSVENLLQKQSDGSITRKPNIAITYLPNPDTTETSILASL